MAEMRVQIVAPSGVIYDHRASMVSARAIDGDISILPNHTPIILPLTIHAVRIKRISIDAEDWVAVNGGVLEVRNNVCSIVADSAERARDIDIERAIEEKHRAEESMKRLSGIKANLEYKRASISLHKALNRINVSKNKRV